MHMRETVKDDEEEQKVEPHDADIRHSRWKRIIFIEE